MNTKAAKTAALVLLVIGVYFMSNNAKPRGIRNNNPLNIRVSGDNWDGAVSDDGEFVIFGLSKMGIRAAARILKNYRDKYGLYTVTGIISRWAPPVENDTQSYIESVAGKMGVSPKETLTDIDYVSLIAAMIYHENGQQPYLIEEIQQGFELGFYS